MDVRCSSRGTGNDYDCVVLDWKTEEVSLLTVIIKRVDMDKTKWIYCPVCGSKTRDRIREDTVLKNYPLYCPNCKQPLGSLPAGINSNIIPKISSHAKHGYRRFFITEPLHMKRYESPIKYKSSHTTYKNNNNRIKFPLSHYKQHTQKN